MPPPSTTILHALLLGLSLGVAHAVTVNETSILYTFANDRISFNILKENGYIQNLVFEGISVLGTVSGNAGQLYTDFPSNGFALTANPTHQIVQGSEYAGIVVTDNDTSTGSLVQRSWFLRDGETGLHSFVRLAYHNPSGPSKGALGEVRTMFRPNGGPWTTLVTNKEQWAPIPGAQAIANQVQLSTWYLGLTPGDSYVQQESDYWTKACYTFADNQTNKAHGLVGQSSDGTSVGAWWVVNQKDTFFGGPYHVDLMVDGIIYNKQSTSHGGATSPNITDGFDRTFGPQFLYLNRGEDATLQTLLADAEQYADPAWNAKFYDEIAPHVVGYVPTSSRSSFSAAVDVPHGAKDVIAILSANGVHFQDSAADSGAYQYWTDVRDGVVDIGRVKAGTYRLTISASGIFGDYVQDNIVVKAGKQTHVKAVWVPESAGTELWRIGVPDKSAGEFKNGLERDTTHPRQPSKYRIYWGAWDFPNEFPGGVNFTIGRSVENRDWNYVHWSQYGPTYARNDTVTDINRWTINFSIDSKMAKNITENSVATFTIQLAAAKTTAGNTDANQGAWPSFPINTYVNGQADPLVWTIQSYESSSCGERSAISCHLLSNKFQFPGIWLKQGDNSFVLELPHAAAVYVQYDALRLELQ
ncbi:galactose mutarotase-like protein [Lentinus tigrinus ALCF2SS1-6]|uniref:Galactose mutarotase-like protein n=1 Tax=Lentinus tigrinus ALCF2SS1-6 TaxID=1328759 RepID=A0A5C2SI75_9APHY|nr:galactose mutarotase-like protein [Lentinus tigrinus ALCF2SS1-6]